MTNQIKIWKQKQRNSNRKRGQQQQVQGKGGNYSCFQVKPYVLGTNGPKLLGVKNQRKLARLITQNRDIFSNIWEGTAFLLQGVTENGSSHSR